MKKLIVLAVIVAGLMAAGVIHFQKDGDQVNISIDRKKLRKVSGELIEEGKDFIDETRRDFDDRRPQASDLRDEIQDIQNDFQSEVRSQSRRFTPSRNR